MEQLKRGKPGEPAAQCQINRFVLQPISGVTVFPGISPARGVLPSSDWHMAGDGQGETGLNYAYCGRVPRPDALLPSGSTAGPSVLQPGLPSPQLERVTLKYLPVFLPPAPLPAPPHPLGFAGGTTANQKHSHAESRTGSTAVGPTTTPFARRHGDLSNCHYDSPRHTWM